jgi:predicted GH43/DUF377 family glycosyl hydrolase
MVIVMLKYQNNPIITPDMIIPSDENLIVKGALNPGAVRYNDEIILLLRIAEGGKPDNNYITVPYYCFDNNKGDLNILKIAKDSPYVKFKDTRAVIYKGKEYVSTLSHLRLARSKDGINFKIDDKPFLVPQNRSEEYGVEDARIVQIGDDYYINYTAVSRDSYGTSLIKTSDFKNFNYLGMIFAPPNKDVCIFPEKINGMYYALHRPYNHDFGKSSIWISSSPDLIHFGNHKCLIRPGENQFETEKIGGGAPPVKTKKGWLEIYHGKSIRNGKDYYSLMVLLLDLNDPSRVIYRSEYPLLKPEEPYETEGFVPNVVFLNGLVKMDDNKLNLYYSACDETTCLATCTLDDIPDI